jgi:tripartite-type tricarboxylate transporter receptor subunit TctC
MPKDKDSVNSFLTRRDFLKISGISAGALATGGVTSTSYAAGRDVYPAKKITFIVPHQPGGGHDIYARTLSPYISKYLKELSRGCKGGEIVIRNESAAGGRKGHALLFNAQPDGYTLGIMDTAPITENLISANNEFDYTKLVFLLLGSTITKLVVTSRNAYNSWNEVMEAQKKQTLKLGVAQFGRANHIVAIVMNEKLGTKFRIIPFVGSADSHNALMRGDVTLAVIAEDASMGLITAKEVKVLLTFTEVSEYPGAVSIKELGHPELADQLNNHRFIVTPPGLAAEPKALLLEAIKRATVDKEYIAAATKANFHLKRIYGSDAEKAYLQLIKFYDGLAPALKKYLVDKP